MKLITEQEAHVMSRFMNEGLDGYKILKEEMTINEEQCVLINDKEMLKEGLYAYTRKEDVLTILKKYNKLVLTDIYAFNEAYASTFPDREDNGILLTEGAVSSIIAKILHVVLGTVGFVPGFAVGEAADAIDMGMYIGQGVMDLNEKDYAGAAVKFIQGCLAALSEIPGADVVTKPMMAVVGAVDKAKALLDKLPKGIKDTINNKVQDMLKDTSFEQKVNNAVVEFKKNVKEQGVSGTVNKGIDSATGSSMLGKVAGAFAKTQTFIAGKGLDLLLAAANKAGFDPIKSIPDDLGTIIMKAFRDFANKVFTVEGSITEPVKDALSANKPGATPPAAPANKEAPPAGAQKLPAAAMRNIMKNAY